LILIGGVSYANALSDQFNFFEAWTVRDNPDLKNLRQLGRVLSLHLIGEQAVADGGALVRRPFVSLTLALNQAFLGPEAWKYRVVNITMHCLSSLFLLGIARRTFQRLRFEPKWANGMAFAVSSFWLVHPLQTEAVNYILQRAACQATLFYFVSFYAAIRHWQLRFDGSQPSSFRYWGIVSIAGAVVAMGSKETAISLPLLVWLYDGVFLSASFTDALRRRPGFYLALAATWLVLGSLVALTLEDVKTDFDPGQMWYHAVRQPTVVVRYLYRVFWPFGITFRAFVINDQPIEPSVVRTAIVVAAGVATVFGLLRRQSWAFLSACVIIHLTPTSTILATDELIQYHRMYLPLAAVAGAVVAGFVALLNGVARRTGMATGGLGAIAFGAVLLILSTTTRARNLDYHSEFGPFAGRELQIMESLSGKRAYLQGDYHGAQRYFEMALEDTAPACDDFAFVTPKVRLGAFHRCRIWNGLGMAHWWYGEHLQAEAFFRRALEQGYASAVSANNLAVALAVRRDLRGAEALLQQSLRWEPKQEAAAHNLAALRHGGRWCRADGWHLSCRDLESLPAPDFRSVQSGFLSSDRPDDYALLLAD
jgi:hypothetical protein